MSVAAILLMAGVAFAAQPTAPVPAAVRPAPHAVAQDAAASDTTAAPAADATAAPAANSAPVNPPPAAPWGWQCKGQGANLIDCSMEQRMVMSNTGQLLISVTIRVPSDTHNPLVMIQAPVGLYLPAGLQLDVDGKPFGSMALQTCDNSGCYSGGPLALDLLAALETGNALSIVFQDLSRKPFTVAVPLKDFSGAYERVVR